MYEKKKNTLPVNYNNKLKGKKHRQFKNKMLSDLLESEKRNPKEFWNCVNKLIEKQKETSQISSEKWVDHFKPIMNIEYSDNFSGSSNEEYFRKGLDNTLLNGDISPEEVLNGVKGLKMESRVELMVYLTKCCSHQSQF